MMLMTTEKAVLRELNRDEMRAERARLLATVAAGEDDLRRRAEDWDLDPAERGVLAEVDGLDWMLEHARA